MPKRLHAKHMAAPQGERYLTLKEVSAKLGNRSRSAIYGDIAAKRLPQPLKLGGRIYWAESVLDAFLRGEAV
ncbi:helix-turn-helix domain-containing protein [Roseobacter sp. AzwK-3b]|uniref:helix-turn-helix transcriptional regulator n=1 Tax=Roseobacter sp. AzwK-3b TaxID=351016 RepID=UPI0002D7DE35|nr:helix-turn-helix domain-containing protein [Roseobacter sp. AzwK-3b]